MDPEFTEQDYGAGCNDSEIFLWALLEDCRNAAKVRRIDSTHILVPDWGQVITLDPGIEPVAAGIRAGDFLTAPPQGDGDTCIRFVIHAPRVIFFDRWVQVRFRPDLRGQCEMTWLVPQENWSEDLPENRDLYVRKKDLRWFCR